MCRSISALVEKRTRRVHVSIKQSTTFFFGKERLNTHRPVDYHKNGRRSRSVYLEGLRLLKDEAREWHRHEAPEGREGVAGGEDKAALIVRRLSH